MSTILLLGASGYIGRAFAGELRRRGHSFIPLTRQAYDYSRFDFLFDYVRTMKPVFLINAAGHSGPGQGVPLPVVREQMMAANAILPQMIARVCSMTKTPWGHVSSGEIYSGAKVSENGEVKIEADLSEPALRLLFEKQPARFHGFTESDPPNFSFPNSSSNFYSGTKALAEDAIREIGQTYIWRPRLPFDDRNEICNYLRRLPQQALLYDHVDSLSNVEDFVRASLDLWEARAPFGIYNVTNPGFMTTRHLAGEFQRIVKPRFQFNFGPPEQNPGRLDAGAPESHCLLDVSKLLKTGVKMRPLVEAVNDSLERLRTLFRSSNGPDLPPIHSALPG